MIRVPSSSEGAVTDHPNPSMAPDCEQPALLRSPPPPRVSGPLLPWRQQEEGPKTRLQGLAICWAVCWRGRRWLKLASVQLMPGRSARRSLSEAESRKKAGGIRSPATQLGGFSRRLRPGRELSARALNPVCQLTGRYPAAEGCGFYAQGSFGCALLSRAQKPGGRLPG